jgi:D-alanyl-D-alanine carboxypeptidase (penicillin-binding protein 5/6)
MLGRVAVSGALIALVATVPGIAPVANAASPTTIRPAAANTVTTVASTASGTPLAPTTSGGPITTLSADAFAGVAGKAFVLMEADSGTILAARQPHQAQFVASTVKIVTALTAIRKLGGMTGTVTASQDAANRPPMKIGMNPGEVWPVKDALYSLLMVSANDAAYALAEGASGSLANFAADMKVTGKALGMKDSTFADPAGLDGTDTDVGASKMSAYDLALAGRALLRDSRLAKIVRTVRYQLTAPDASIHNLVNHNRALNQATSKYYAGTLGIKTGFTTAASGTYVTAATRNGKTLIAVIVGNKDIYAPAQALLDYGFTGTAPATTAPTPASPASPAVTDVDPEIAAQTTAPRAAVTTENPALLATTTLPTKATVPALATTTPPVTLVAAAPLDSASSVATTVVTTVVAAGAGGSPPGPATSANTEPVTAVLFGGVALALALSGWLALSWWRSARAKRNRHGKALARLVSLRH